MKIELSDNKVFFENETFLLTLIFFRLLFSTKRALLFDELK